MAKVYSVAGTDYEFPDTMDDDKAQSILVNQGIIKPPQPKMPVPAALGPEDTRSALARNADFPSEIKTDPMGAILGHGLIGQGISQAGRGIAALATPGRRMAGASDLIEGAGRAALPAALPFAVASPLSALGGAAAGIAGSKGGEKLTEKLGGSPDAQRLAGDVGGILTGGVGSKLGSAAESALALPLAKTALRLPGKSEAYGATPAQALLNETRGIRPSTIAASAQERMNTLKPQMENIVSQSKTPVPLAPSRQSVQDALDLATRQGNLASVKQLEPMLQALQGNRVTGTQYPSQLPPAEALHLKRGFGDEFATYNPDIHESVNAAAKNARGLLNQGIHAAAPGAQELDQRIQSLIPVKHAAEKVDLAPDLAQRTLYRMSRPTGGMLPALIGFREGGPLGAAAGMLGSEAAASPVPLMIGARALHGAGKITAPPVLQLPLTRKEKEQR